MNAYHVIPLRDAIAHEESEDCVCMPRVTFVEGGKVVVHASLDGREMEERKRAEGDT